MIGMFAGATVLVLAAQMGGCNTIEGIGRDVTSMSAGTKAFLVKDDE